MKNFSGQAFYSTFLNSFFSLPTLFIFLLMPFNWFCEVLKWNILQRKIGGDGWLTDIKSVFSGVSLSVFLPNRMGEYIGRLLYLKNEKRVSGTLLTLVGGFAQFIATVGFGFLAWMSYLNSEVELSFVFRFWSIFAFAVVVLSILLIYFQIGLFYSFLSNIKYLKKYKTELLGMQSLPKSILFSVLFISLLRYCIFTFQYFLALSVFADNILFSQVWSSISLIFLVQSAIPVPVIVDIGVRGNVALFFLGSYGNMEVLSSTFLIWFINIVLPALLGYIFILRKKVQ